jgi:GNAT superfamily N-acetyltransferase
MAEDLPLGYRLVPWHEGLIDAHARTKFRSFRSEIDAVVFPCLGDLEGCRRLMREIRGKGGFLPGATWLIARSRPFPAGLGPDTQASRPAEVEWCGTIQGVIDSSGAGSIQNIGVVPGHRGRGLGSYLIAAAMRGFTEQSLPRATLEVTADNVRAVSLYQRLGFRRVKTIYKVVDNASWQFQEREPALL